MATEDAQGKLRWRPMTVLVLVVVALGSSQGQGSCPSRCTCEGETADCSQSRLSAPPRQYPAGTKTINIESNHIRVLGSRSFNQQANIEVLRAAGNRIRRLSNDAFWRPLPGLVTLDLSRNRIRRITSNALRNMASLMTLDLSQNQIRSLTRIFHGTPNLFQLKMARNRIPRLGENDLAPLTAVRNVDLTSNNIGSIHPRAFKNLTRLRYLYLNHNPIGQMPELDIGSQVLQMVDLSHAQLTAVPKPFPASTRELRLNHNLVEQVQHTDFLAMQDLGMLMMNDNKLNFFADGALSHLSGFRELWLRNNELVYVPRNLPDTVGAIIMSDNRIQEVETDLFGENSQLSFLLLRHNLIDRIRPHTFRGLRFLNQVDFQGNQISVLETDTFVGLGSLATLILSANPIVRIEQGAFRNLANLTKLLLPYVDGGEFELEYNFLPEMLRLKELNLYASPHLTQRLMERVRDAGHVTPLSHLETLDASHNNLESVPARVRQLFPNIRVFLLDGNPFRCTQSLRWLRQWMDEAGSQVQFYAQVEPTCDRPLRLRDRPISSLADSEWAADDEQDPPTLPPGGYDWGVANDQPQEQRMRTQYLMRSLRRGQGRGSDKTKVAKGKAEKQNQGGKVVESVARPMSMVDAPVDAPVASPQIGTSGKLLRPAGKPTRSDRNKGKKNRRQQGRRGKKGRKGKGKKRCKEEGKNKCRRNGKNRERKRRRRVTVHTRREA